MKKKLVLQPNKGPCTTCDGSYFAPGRPNMCPYVRRLVDEFVGRQRWERTRFHVESDADTSVCDMKFQTFLKDAGIVTIEAVFKTVHTMYAKSCSLEVKVQGEGQEDIAASIENLMKHNLPL